MLDRTSSLAVELPAGDRMPERRRLLFLLDPARIWRWQAELVAEFAAASGFDVAVASVSATRSLPRGLSTLFVFERLLYGQKAVSAADIVDIAAIFAPVVAAPGHDCDLVIDLSGAGAAARAIRAGVPTLTLLYDGFADDTAAIAALIEGRRPRLTLAGCDDDGLVAARPAVEEPRILSQALDPVFSMAAELVRRAIREGTVDGEAGGTVPPATRDITCKPLAFALSTFAAKIAARLDRQVRTAPQWAIGWRQAAAGTTIADRLMLPKEGYRRLPDDGQRYYADPFVMVRDGRRYVFCEEYPYATGKGVISVFTIEPDGSTTTPRIVLERPYHLSYPFVFERDGEVYMMPETLANRTIELYRAVQFPDRWEKVETLLDDVAASDATLVEHGGRLWIFAAISDRGCSSWGSLGLYHADDLFGTWTALPANPVLADAAAARPGGEMYVRDGVLYRPAQDCREFYGGGLTLARVDRLDPEGFSQTVVARLKPNPARPEIGMHTVNVAGGIEVVDVFGEFPWTAA